MKAIAREVIVFSIGALFATYALGQLQMRDEAARAADRAASKAQPGRLYARAPKCPAVNDKGQPLTGWIKHSPAFADTTVYCTYQS